MAGTNWQSEVRIQALVDTDTSHHPSSCRLYFGFSTCLSGSIFLKKLTICLVWNQCPPYLMKIFISRISFLLNWVAFSLENIVFAEMLSYLLHWGLLSSGIYLGGFFSKLIFYIFLKKSYIIVDQYFPDFFSKL